MANGHHIGISVSDDVFAMLQDIASSHDWRVSDAAVWVISMYSRYHIS